MEPLAAKDEPALSSESGWGRLRIAFLSILCAPFKWFKWYIWWRLGPLTLLSEVLSTGSSNPVKHSPSLRYQVCAVCHRTLRQVWCISPFTHKYSHIALTGLALPLKQSHSLSKGSQFSRCYLLSSQCAYLHFSTIGYPNSVLNEAFSLCRILELLHRRFIIWTFLSKIFCTVIQQYKHKFTKIFIYMHINK